MEVPRKTLSEEVAVFMPPYFATASQSLRFEPSFERKGVWFRNNGREVPINHETLRGHRDISGARYNVIQEGDKVLFKVVEHVLSAIHLAGITDVTVVSSRGFLPVVGPGVTPVLNRLEDNGVEREGEQDIFSFPDYEIRDESGAVLRVNPSDSFGISVESYYKDLADIGTPKLMIDDVLEDSNIVKGSVARPVARLQAKALYQIWKVLNKGKVFRGIDPCAYIIARPGMDGSDIRGLMGEHFQEKGDEHYWHSVYADIFGEIKTIFPGEIRGHFDFEGSNHISRVRMLQDLRAKMGLEDS